MAEMEFQIRQGMDVEDLNGKKIGTLDSILVEDDTGLARFVIVEGRLLPVEALKGAHENVAEVTITKDKLENFPQRGPGEMPSPEEMNNAYGELGIEGPLVEGA